VPLYPVRPAPAEGTSRDSGRVSPRTWSTATLRLAARSRRVGPLSAIPKSFSAGGLPLLSLGRGLAETCTQPCVGTFFIAVVICARPLSVHVAFPDVFGVGKVEFWDIGGAGLSEREASVAPAICSRTVLRVPEGGGAQIALEVWAVPSADRIIRQLFGRHQQIEEASPSNSGSGPKSTSTGCSHRLSSS